MKYRKVINLLALAMVLTVTACNDSEDVSRTTAGITINFPEGISAGAVSHDTLTFVNVATGESVKIPASQTPVLPQGLYNCFYKADVTYQENGDQIEGRLRGASESVKLIGSETSFTMNTHLLIDENDFIIEEIFFTGTLRASNKQYYGDDYVKIYNNTDRILYADGLALVESKFISTEKYDYTPDIREDTMTVHAIYVVPGSGKEHPVLPGQSMILCDTGIDHRVANPNSFDLSAADFEWYDVSTEPNNMDIDSKTVPNLDKWYCYTLSFWVLHNRGFCSYALARIPIDKETYLRDYYYTYSYTMYLPAGTFPMQQSAYKIPNSWIVDGVNCSVEAARVWDILPPNVDAGWTHCGKIDHDKERYFKSVRRKVAGFENGRCILQDTNNSSDDFNTECVPSIIEQQGTAKDAQGTKASTVTWDGVMPKTESNK